MIGNAPTLAFGLAISDGISLGSSASDGISPKNLMKQATTMKDVALPGLIPGITVSSSPDDYRLIKALRPQRFDGERWIPTSGAMGAR